MLYYNGNLIIKVAKRTYASMTSGPVALVIPGYELEPLFRGHQATSAFSPDIPADNWFLAGPALSAEGPPRPPTDGSPWDVAHQVARAGGYSFYAEPDFIRTPKSPYPETPTVGLSPDWPPAAPVNPGWHLYDQFTGFLSARGAGMLGTGVKIAHLDTGYSEKHHTKPLHLHPELGWNFYEGNSCTVDPGTNFGWPPPTPGHGTATLAFLAGNKLDMIYGGHPFHNKYFGGAPESDVIPVRIGASVIHFEDSAMAKGIDYALAPRHNPANQCDVITLSHGGYPSLSWAAAVNNVYDAGIILAAASGDNEIVVVDIPGHETIWPSRFRRAITVTGATYDKTPYVTDKWFVLQGSWGPEDVMNKAIASYAPNTAWMLYDTTVGYDMNGGGTSAATPQVAAACALWVQKNARTYPKDWMRVEACRYALFHGADKNHNQDSGIPIDQYFGQGLLRVPDMLNVVVDNASLVREPVDTVESLVWQAAMGLGPSLTDQNLMYEVEAAQIIARSRNLDLLIAMRDFAAQPSSTVSQVRIRELLAAEPDVSQAFRQRLARP